jgi:hypothetical protein
MLLWLLAIAALIAVVAVTWFRAPPPLRSEPPSLFTCSDNIPSEGTPCRTNAHCQDATRMRAGNPLCSNQLTGETNGVCMAIENTLCVREHHTGVCPVQPSADAIAASPCRMVQQPNSTVWGGVHSDCIARMQPADASVHLLWQCTRSPHVLEDTAQGSHDPLQSSSDGVCANMRKCRADSQCGAGALCLKETGLCLRVCSQASDCPGGMVCERLSDLPGTAVTECDDASVRVCLHDEA